MLCVDQLIQLSLMVQVIEIQASISQILGGFNNQIFSNYSTIIGF
jgi:hypothetical protein